MRGAVKNPVIVREPVLALRLRGRAFAAAAAGAGDREGDAVDAPTVRVAARELGEQVSVEFGELERLDATAVPADDVGVRLLREVDSHHALRRLRNGERRRRATTTGRRASRGRRTPTTRHLGRGQYHRI
jgi:hypothetical protein